VLGRHGYGLGITVSFFLILFLKVSEGRWFTGIAVVARRSRSL
jgi:hypothetical protein